jgi:D-alanine-D-alanine ligase-like ATP-grasp enzyme
MFSQCPHCQPYDEYTHVDDWISGRLRSITDRLSRKCSQTNQNKRSFTDKAWITLLQFLRRVGACEFVAEPDRSQLYNRGLIFFDEAKRRGVDIWAVKLFGQYVHEYLYRHNDTLRLFHKLPTINGTDNSCIDNKIWAKKQLQSNGIPVPAGDSFWRTKTGIRLGRQIGFPLVVKPTHGSLSKHVTVNITSEDELRSAIKIAKQFNPAYIIEEYLTGNLYRASVINQNHVFVCQKKRPHVIGDGKNTIEQLINDKNSNQKRGDTNQKNATLHIINKANAKKHLQASDYNLRSIPEANEEVILSDTYTLKAGCDIIECTNQVHEQTKQIFRNAAKALSAGLIGFDFICPDISQPYTDQTGGIIEANTKPYVDMHVHPTNGKSQPVAEAVWNATLQR